MFNNKKFKQLRQVKKVSVEDLADKLGISFSTIYKYQSGLYSPDDETIDKIADILNVNVDQLTDKFFDNSTESNLTPWKDEAYLRLKVENQNLWNLVQKLTGSKVADLGKLVVSKFTTKETPIVPLFTSLKTKQIA
jgi:transcriptional regulator with XRE-family HTH domain